MTTYQILHHTPRPTPLDIRVLDATCSCESTDPRPIYGPIRRSRDVSHNEPCEHSETGCFDCWSRLYCYECGGPLDGNHASCFVAPCELGL